MSAVFADTSFYFALLNTGDLWHQEAVRWSMELQRRVVLTEFVLMELGNSLARGKSLSQ